MQLLKWRESYWGIGMHNWIGSEKARVKSNSHPR
jgi:hypothetical protein